jgi:hypothetical protein
LNPYVAGIYEIHGLHVAETDALGIAVAKIAFDHLAVDRIEMHGTEGANGNTGAAPDTFIIVDLHPPRFPVSRNGLGRAGIEARGIFTLLARHGNVYAHVFPFDHPDAASAWVGNMVVLDSANELAQSAARAFFIIDLQRFGTLMHGLSPFQLRSQ